MSSSGSGLPSIEKLQGSSNFDTWKFDVECILVHDDLWQYVESSPKDNADDKRKDQKARTKICLLIENHCKVHVRRAKTAFETWNNLKTAYEDKGVNNRCRLLARLVSLKSSLFNSITEYVTELMRVSHQLSDLGKEIDDELLAALMLQGLPEEYTPLRLAIESTNTVLTTDYVKTKLLQLDGDKACTSKSATNSSSSALTVKNQTNRNDFHKNRDKKKREKTIKCFICEGSHKACDCPHNPRNNKKVNFVTALGTEHEDKKTRDKFFILDSGASTHMSCRKDWLHDFVEVERKVEVSCANGGKVYGEGYGMVANEMLDVTVNDVMYVPGLSTNLLSISKITNKNKIVIFTNKGCEIYNTSDCEIAGTPILKGDIDGGIYKLEFTSQENVFTSTAASGDLELWHKRMAHLGLHNLLLLSNEMANGVSLSRHNNRNLDCVACLLGKQTREPFERNKVTRAKDVLDLVHSDVCGAMNIESFGGKRYFITFIDDYSRKTYVYFLKQKSETFEIIKEFKVFVETQTGKKLKVLRTDNGGEYVNKNVDGFLREHGIKHQLTIAYTPQQNGVAERANRTITEKARAMLQDAGLPDCYWAEAVNTAVYLKNRSPTVAVQKMTPEEAWTGRKVDLSHLKVFGCRAFVHIPDEKRTKWDPKSKEFVFVGYCDESKGYRLVNPTNRQLHKARDVVFFENQMYQKVCQLEKQKETVTVNQQNNEMPQHTQNEPVPQRVQIQLEEPVQEENLHDRDIANLSPESDEEENEHWTSFEGEGQEHLEAPHNSETGTVVERRYPLRDRNPTSFPDYVTYLTMTDENDPVTVHEALSRKDCKLWKAAIQEELDALHKNNTWLLVKPAQGANVVDSKWIFRIKKEAGNKTRYKARLVARGFSQRKGIDYDETFSPVIRHSTLRLLLALAANLNLTIDHMDVKTAFLNGNVDEVIYMRQPPQFEEKGKEDHVCLLQKSLYGLKQAPRSWNMKLHTELESLNFKRCKNESCVYIRSTGKDKIILAVYVDDILLFYNNLHEIQRVKRELMSKFEMKDLGRANLFLGMRLKQENGCITVDQEEYIDNLLHRFRMEDCKTVSTPGVPGQHFTKPECSKPDVKIPYRELIGSLMYLAVCTRPDIAHSVNYMSQFSNYYEEIHWTATKRILRYLKGTKSMGLKYYQDKTKNIQGFADADHGGDLVDRRSYSGYIFKMANGAISWQSRKQRSIAISTAEAEYVSLSEAAKEAVFLKRFLEEIMGKAELPILIHTDSQSAQAIAQNPVHHQKIKHVDVRYHFIREKIQDGIVSLTYLETRYMVADSLTKAVVKEKHDYCRTEMGVVFFA